MKNKIYLTVIVAVFFTFLTICFLVKEYSGHQKLNTTKLGDWTGETLLIVQPPITNDGHLIDVSSGKYESIHDQISPHIEASQDALIYVRVKGNIGKLPKGLVPPFDVVMFGKMWLFYQRVNEIIGNEVILEPRNVYKAVF